MKRMTVRLCGDLFDYCKTYGQVVERFEVIARFSMVDEMHTEVCKFTIKESVPIDQIQCNYISDLIVLRSDGREFTCLAKGTFSDDITRFLNTYGSKFDYPVVFENDCLTFSLIGNPEDFQTFVSDAREQGWGLEILSVCEYQSLHRRDLRCPDTPAERDPARVVSSGLLRSPPADQRGRTCRADGHAQDHPARAHPQSREPADRTYSRTDRIRGSDRRGYGRRYPNLTLHEDRHRRGWMITPGCCPRRGGSSRILNDRP